MVVKQIPKQPTLVYPTYSSDTALLSRTKNTYFLSTELTLQPFETKCIGYFQLQHELTH